MPELGKYIVIEGSDGTGKSTQAIRVTQKLHELGYDPLVVHNDETGQMEPVQEPGGTPTANEIRKRIKDASIPRTPWQNVEWFTDARKSIWNEAIAPALESGRPVVTARSWISTVAYQGYGEGVDIERIRQITLEQVGEDYINPDLVCILALQDESIRRARMVNRSHESSQKDTFESMPTEFQENMKDGYVKFAEAEELPIIDAGQTPDQVFDDIWTHVQQLLNR